MRETLSASKRIVVKVGTGVVTRPDGRMALGRTGALVEQICALVAADHEVLLVSSGAVGLGAERLGFPKRPDGVVDRQACAAAGQGNLMAFYDGLFRRLGGVCAQVLLTEDDFHERRRYLNLSSTLQRLLTLKAVPIINENDTVSTAEVALRGPRVFGDNDRLSALVASNLGADLLVLLTNVDGIYTAPPGEPGAVRVPVYEEPVKIGSVSAGGRGGMSAKIEAATVAAKSGVAVVVADGFDPRVLERILEGEDVGTLFVPQRHEKLSRRRQWLAYATSPAGRIVVNPGAHRALVERKASLLLPGVVRVEGDFEAGAVVSVVTEDGTEFARGICARTAADTRADMGRPQRGKALVHRDNVVILE